MQSPELELAFGRELESVPVGHPALRGIKGVKYREKAKKIVGETMTSPLLKMIQEDGKTKVLFSPLDLAVGLVGQPIDGISGYQPESAMELMGNLLMYGLTMR